MRWWRAYAGSRRDPKLRQLSDRQFRVWYDILCLAAEYNGEIPVADLTHHLTGRSDHTLRTVSELLDYGLLTYGGGLIIPHNWHGRQYKSDLSTARVRRFRQRRKVKRRNGQSETHETAPEKKESKKEREVVRKWVAELERRLTAESNVTDITSLRRLKPLSKWKG